MPLRRSAREIVAFGGGAGNCPLSAPCHTQFAAVISTHHIMNASGLDRWSHPQSMTQPHLCSMGVHCPCLGYGTRPNGEVFPVTGKTISERVASASAAIRRSLLASGSPESKDCSIHGMASLVC